jgi:hypothetical protein
LLESTVTGLSTWVTPPPKSLRLKTCELLRLKDREVRLFAAEICTRRRYGPVTEAGALKLPELLNGLVLGSLSEKGP